MLGGSLFAPSSTIVVSFGFSLTCLSVNPSLRSLSITR
jgi:hypothetical protein